MSYSKPNQPIGSSRSIHSARIIAQTRVDAMINTDFEECRDSFDYVSSIRRAETSSENKIPNPAEVTTAYLHQIQKSKAIQPFGCLLAIDEKTLKIIAYSENAPEMLTLVNQTVPSVGDHPVISIGTDVRSIFTTPSSVALQKAAGFGDVSLLNPILVHCRASGKPFYAIAHRVTHSLIIDFEPATPLEVPMTAAGALQSYKLAAKAISRLQSLPKGGMERLCNAMIQEVFELTGYDRVMIYKFHDDDHGEVAYEITKPGHEPYKGLHYPATDIPQASRFLFMRNKVRMIFDCFAKNVNVIQDEKLSFEITLCGSTLRAPHTCHLQYMENMTSTASLVMAVVINNRDEQGETSDSSQPQLRKRLWGLVVCHNKTPKFVPFPMRYACEFLVQVFATHVNKELDIENQIREKNILHTQTLLCDMLMRDAPLSIVTKSPNIMDLVECDGASLLYNNKVWRLGLTPNDSQLRDIASWFLKEHMDSTGLSTDSLYDAGFPGASTLGDKVCGMAAVRITSKDMLFWFRTHRAAAIHWGGAKHAPGERDDGRKMNPRSSFKAFLDVVKMKSNPWKDYEMDAIHSLQLILRNTLRDMVAVGWRNSPIQEKLSGLKIEGLKELEALTNDMVHMIETAPVPILSVDVDGMVNGWNTKIAELTGIPIDDAIGKPMLTMVEESSVYVVEKMLDLALRGQEEHNVYFQLKTHMTLADSGPVSLVVNACTSKDADQNVVGVCFVAQDITDQKTIMDKFTRIEGDYKAIIESPSLLIPPIFGADEFGWCSEWNPAMSALSGFSREDVIDKMILGEVFGTHNKACCRLKDQEAFIRLGVLLNNAMTGHELEKSSFGFISRGGMYIECLLSINMKMNKEGAVTGIFCFLQLASQELQHALFVQRLSEKTALRSLKMLSYMKRQVRNSLGGIKFSQKLLDGTKISEEQKHLFNTSSSCQRQLAKILDDTDLEGLIDGYLNLEMVEFTLGDVLTTSVSQVMIKSNSKDIEIINDSKDEILSVTFYGDGLRLQQIVADFLLLSVNFSQDSGTISMGASFVKKYLAENFHLAQLELRISWKVKGEGESEQVLEKMIENEEEEGSEEGVSVQISRKLVKLMNGDVHFLKQNGTATIIISVELPLVSSHY